MICTDAHFETYYILVTIVTMRYSQLCKDYLYGYTMKALFNTCHMYVGIKGSNGFVHPHSHTRAFDKRISYYYRKV